MKYTKPLFILLLSTILFVLGQAVFIGLFGFFEPKIDGITFQIIERRMGLKTSILFSITLALVPVLVVLTWQLSPVISAGKRLASVLIILIFMISAIGIRHQEVKTFFNTVVKKIILSNGSHAVNYPIDPVNFVYYMIGGLCTGCIVSFFLFRRKKG